MSSITHLKAREILDSRGNPTLEVDITLDNLYEGRASVPSGASTGTEEAYELRDHDPKRYRGLGVLKAISFIDKEIKSNLLTNSFENQAHLDDVLIKLDGTPHKSRLGANSLLAISLAFAQASALKHKIPLFRSFSKDTHYTLPVPLMNIINGGAHADNALDIQECMIMPRSVNSVKEAIRMGAEIFHSLKKILHSKNYSTNVGDEGGFAPNVRETEEALDLIIEATIKAGFKPGHDIMIAIDAASNEFYKEGHYFLDGKALSYEGLTDFYENLSRKYPLFSIEDGMAETDIAGWKHLTSQLGKKIQLVGDDLFVTNPAILQKGITNQLANALLVKSNQIGTLTETLEAMQIACNAGYNTIISHRSGETEDVFIAHLAVGTAAGQIKTGSLSRSDRVAKYNELIRIEEYLGKDAIYASSIFNSDAKNNIA